LYLNTHDGVVSIEQRGVQSQKFAWNDKTNLPIEVYYTNSRTTMTIGSPDGPNADGKNLGQVYTHFSVEDPDYQINSIAAFHQKAQAWYINFQNPNTNKSSVYIVDLEGDVTKFHHSVRIFDMFYNRTSAQVVLVYSEEGFDSNCGNFGESKASNPRANNVYFATIVGNALHTYRTISVGNTCLRWHAISATTGSNYLFYTQKDFMANGQLNYNNGLGYSSSGSRTHLTPYWGAGIDNAVWGFCPVSLP
jgi:hypothetical protein